MLRPSRFELQYGAFFDAPSPDLPEALIHYCQDTCRAIELLEGQKIIFDPVKADKAESGDTHYFYFIRSRLANEFIHLNAEFAKRFDRARCILLAAKIVEYLVLVDNYIITIPIFLARGIHECLQAQNIVKEWSGIEDLFMWVLWVAACVPQIDDKLRTEFIFLAKEGQISSTIQQHPRPNGTRRIHSVIVRDSLCGRPLLTRSSAIYGRRKQDSNVK